jgi:hypothetical protein
MNSHYPAVPPGRIMPIFKDKSNGNGHCAGRKTAAAGLSLGAISRNGAVQHRNKTLSFKK